MTSTLDARRVEAEVQGSLRVLIRRGDWLLGMLVVAVLLILIVPLAPALLDLALTLNITMAVVVLLMTLHVRTPLEFSTLPTVLLGATLLRLSLNVASTRLILLDGRAGDVIQAFGSSVVGGNLVVGLVVFLIVVIIQFVVITKGATRISEVAARFTLDAMPGKQMAIDADLNAGLIDQREATARRDRIAHEAEFHGAMDGASKFVRGDAIAGLIITAINLVGGVVLGVLAGRPFDEALRIYALLTVGDGIVSQVPALLISVAAGVIVTKTTSKDALARQMSAQVLSKPGALGIASAALVMIALFPGMPKLPFLLLALVLFGVYRGTRHLEGVAEDLEREEEERLERLRDGEAAPAEAGGDAARGPMEALLDVDRLGLEIGVRLIDLVEAPGGAGLLDHIRNLRKQFAANLGLLVPPVRVKDNLRLHPKEYRILIGGCEVARGSLEPGLFLAMRPGPRTDDLDGLETTDPTFGFPARWIDARERDRAELLGYSTVEPVAVLVTHLTEKIRENAHELLSRDDVKRMVEHVKEASPAVVEELVGSLLSIGEIQRVLRNLLRERVPIRNLPGILEALADHAATTKDVDLLTEFVRRRLGRLLVADAVDEHGVLHAVTLEPEIERRMLAATRPGGSPDEVNPRFLHEVVQHVREAFEIAREGRRDPVLLVRPQARRFVRDLIEKDLPRVRVYSYTEVQGARTIEPVAMAGALRQAV